MCRPFPADFEQWRRVAAHEAEQERLAQGVELGLGGAEETLEKRKNSR